MRKPPDKRNAPAGKAEARKANNKKTERAQKFGIRGAEWKHARGLARAIPYLPEEHKQNVIRALFALLKDLLSRPPHWSA